MNMPCVGDKLQVHCYKHDGQFHRAWHEAVILKATQYILITANDKTMVTESDGRSWWTREPAISYFHHQNWFNVIGMLRTDGVYYYCNISSPYVYSEETIKYIDYDLDVKVFPDMSYVILDEDEYEENREKMRYPKNIDYILKRNLELLIDWIKFSKGPFAPGFVDKWHEHFLELSELSSVSSTR